MKKKKNRASVQWISFYLVHVRVRIFWKSVFNYSSVATFIYSSNSPTLLLLLLYNLNTIAAVFGFDYEWLNRS